MQERMEKQMEILTTILHKLMDERRRDYETIVTRDEATAEPSHRRHRNEEVPPLGGQAYGYIPIVCE